MGRRGLIAMDNVIGLGGGERAARPDSTRLSRFRCRDWANSSTSERRVSTVRRRRAPPSGSWCLSAALRLTPRALGEIMLFSGSTVRHEVHPGGGSEAVARDGRAAAQAATPGLGVCVSRSACLTFVAGGSDDLSGRRGARRWTLIRTRSTRQYWRCFI